MSLFFSEAVGDRHREHLHLRLIAERLQETMAGAVVAVMSVQPTSEKRTVLQLSASPAAAAPVIALRLAPSASRASKALSFIVIFCPPYGYLCNKDYSLLPGDRQASYWTDVQ